MATPISLKAIVDELEIMSEQHLAYLNPKTGALELLSLEEISIVEEELPTENYPTWQQESIMKAREVLDSEDYIQLPTQHDIHEYEIMERFCNSLKNDLLRDTFLDQIRGSGAFRRFRQALDRYDLTQNWYQFRTTALEAIAIEWLEANNIPYQRSSS